MLYVGLDVHAKQITGCVLNQNGNVIKRWQVRTLIKLLCELKSLGQPLEICFEASCGYGTMFRDLQPLAERVVVAHPGLLRLIFQSKHKHDRADALKLAKLLYLGEVPTVHVPSANVQAWRETITLRRRFVEKRTRAKNGIRALLRSLRMQAPSRSSLWSKRGLAWLRELPFAQPMHALRRDLLLDEIESLTVQIRRIERALQKYADGCPAVQLLRTIPGIGPRTAEAVVAYLDDPRRFAHSKKVAAYFGLVPSQDQSGGTNRLGHITRQGSSSVRHLLTEAVWQSTRRSPTVQAYFARIHRGDRARRKIAVVATAHYLVRVMWSMLKRGRKWQETVTATKTES